MHVTMTSCDVTITRDLEILSIKKTTDQIKINLCAVNYSNLALLLNIYRMVTMTSLLLKYHMLLIMCSNYISHTYV